MNPNYRFVALRAGHRCEYCQAPEVVFNFPFEVEHIIALVHNGANAEYNWALACRACNLRKGIYSSHIDPLTQATVRLYHPRQDNWEQHFSIDVETGEFQGSTAIGRATIARLDMNHPTQLFARQLWMRLGLFP